MKFLEGLQNESLSKREQVAFAQLADALIFETPRNFRLSRKTIPDFSRFIQEDFLQQENNHRATASKWTRDTIFNAFSSLQTMMGEPIPEPDPEIPEETYEKHIESLFAEGNTMTEVFVKITEKYLFAKGLDDSNPYNPWGFTPNLAGRRASPDRPFAFGKDGSNCLGFVQVLASLYNKLGLKFEMGISADHPFLIVEVEGKTYLSSLFGVAEAKGSFEMQGTQKMYKPLPADDLNYELVTVWNFDEALVYEMLENFEILRQMSLGNNIQTLPNSEESGMELAKENKIVLQGTSWRTLQKKLVPGLARHFHDHRTEWTRELERVTATRESRRLFKEIMDYGQRVTSLRGETFDDFKAKFLPIVKVHGQAIANFIAADVAFDSEVPADVVLFSQEIKRNLDAISTPTLRRQVTESFLRPFTASPAKEELTGT